MNPEFTSPRSIPKNIVSSPNTHIDIDLSALLLHLTQHGTQQRRLAHAHLPDHGDEGALGHLDVDALQSGTGVLVAVPAEGAFFDFDGDALLSCETGEKM